MPNIQEMLQEAQDAKDAKKADKAYNAASSIAPNPKPVEPAVRKGDAKPVKKYAKGGFVRAADGIASKGKTKGRMI